jgi:hypothetical protein
MWPFSRAVTTEELRGHKRITVNGMRFTIRKLNPMIDFPADKMPQIFTSFVSRRPVDEEVKMTPEAIRKSQEDMYSVLRVGIVDPVIKAEDAKDGLKASDLFRDPSMGPKLFIEIIAHSLQTFRGLKGLFFFHRIKFSLWTEWLKGMGKRRQELFSQVEA